MLSYRSFWYVVAQSAELGPKTVLRRKVLGEWMAVFRGDGGHPAALRDRCMHRNAPLSKGMVNDGLLQCPYHGWVYDGAGTVVAVPAEGEKFKASKRRCAVSYPVIERDGFVYARLDKDAPEDIQPYSMPHWGERGWKHVRLVNRFRNNVTNCAENFIDVPHTVYVHDKIFRVQRSQKVDATIRRTNGSVQVEYHGETSNLGWFSWFLNPKGSPIEHRDNFYMPNVTEVEYTFSENRRLYIISQTVPEEDHECVVYTSLTYDFGPFSQWPLSEIAGRILGWQGQKVIDQDIDALHDQMDVIGKYGEAFNNTAADAIHVLVESIRDELLAGRDPRALPEKSRQHQFLGVMLELGAFWLLVVIGARRSDGLRAYKNKPLADWMLDGIGLAVQGALIPFLQIAFVVAGLQLVAPALAGSVHLPGDDLIVGFLLNVIAIDYLYYWNHRLLHSRRLWPVHLVHHTLTEMDVVGTSRNTVWTSFFILYLWVNGVIIFLLAEPAGFIAGAAVTAALDLWRHSSVEPRRGGRLERVLGTVLVLPRDHAWHHADSDEHGNFGANFRLWDLLHGTYLGRRPPPPRLGCQSSLSLPQKLLWPLS